MFLAAPAGRDWPALATVLGKYGLAGYGGLSDERFATEASRAANAAALTAAGCRLGQHTDALLRELGYDDATIASLRERDIVR